MIKTLKRVFQFIVLLCIGLLICILFLLGTEPGIEVDFALAKIFLPGHLSGQVHGRVLGHVHLTNLSYESKSINLKINNFELKWLPVELLQGVWRIENLNIENAHLVFHEETTSNQTPKKSKQGFAFPLRIVIVQSQLTDINIGQPRPAAPIYIQQAKITGQVNFATTGLTTDLSGQWQNFNWIFGKDYLLKLPQGTIAVSGPLSQYQYHVTGQAHAADAPVADLDIKGSGSLEDITITQLLGTTIQGQLQGQGHLAWHDGFSWQGNLTAQQINPEYYVPKLTGRVNFTAHGSGENKSGQSTWQVNLPTLNGTVANYQLQGHIEMSHQNGQFTMQPSVIQLGAAKAQMQGQFGKTWDLQWLIHFPHLNAVLDKAQGSIDSQGHIQGDRNKPIINATINAENLVYNTFAANKLTGSIHFDTASQDSSNLNLVVSQIQVNKTKIDSINIQSNGTLAQHRLTLTLQQKKDNLMLKLEGRYTPHTWSSTINTLDLNSSLIGKWTLDKPTTLTLGSDNIVLASLCWQSRQTKLCGEFKKQQTTISGQMTLAGFNLSHLQNLLGTQKNQPQLQGNLNGKLSWDGTVTKPNINGEAKLQNGTLTIPAQGLVLKKLNINIQGRGNTLQYNVQAQSGPGTITLTGNTDFAQTGMPTQLKIQGNNVQVSNTDTAQVIASPDLVMVLKNGALETTGKIVIPKARITPADFSSTVEMPNDVVYTDEEKKGSRPILMTTHITVTLGNAVHFSYKGLDADITGTLELKDYPSGTTTANGELIISKGQFVAYGQNLTIREGRILFAGGPVTNPGLSVQAVRYVNTLSSAANADSTTNNAGKTMVGVNIAGTVQQPVVTLFSIPSGLSQTQILSYLVLGHSLDQSSTPGEGQTLAQAAMALNLAGGTVSEVQNKVKSMFGLSELEIGQQQEYTTKNVSSPTLVQNTSLILGKYLTPKLYANISIGLAEPINTLNVSYQLTKNWRVESNANSMGSGVDLIYSIERDQFKIFHLKNSPSAQNTTQ